MNRDTALCFCLFRRILTTWSLSKISKTISGGFSRILSTLSKMANLSNISVWSQVGHRVFSSDRVVWLKVPKTTLTYGSEDGRKRLINVNFANYYNINWLHFCVCVCAVIDHAQMTSQWVKNKKYDTRRSRVAWLLFFTRCDVFCDLLQYTHTEENVIYLFYTIKIQTVYWRIFGEWKKKNKPNLKM